MPQTLCECLESGFCPRHRCVKPPHWHHLCLTHSGYFQLWEEGRGPGQNLLPTRDLTRPCSHRGELRREEKCPSCGGVVHLKVFGCGLHNECTIGRLVAGLACCASCAEFNPLQEPQDHTQESGA
jgi:hypothetical protein